MRVLTLLPAVLLLSACVDATPPATRPAMKNSLPNPMLLVGEAGSGNVATGELRNDGIAVQTDFKGRAAGIVAFCSGKADAVLMSGDFSSAEWKKCKDLGGIWSAFGTRKGAVIYVRHELADPLLKKAKTTFQV